MTLLPWFILITLYGACIGSFLNVVIYRLPREESLSHPGSRCPGCGNKIAWYDNLPVLSWLILRGRCRHCDTRISVQYPIIEAVTALLFAGLFTTYYFTDLRPAFYEATFYATWPALVVHLVLLAALIAATMIDAKLYIIPLSIPVFATLAALIVLPVAVALGWQTQITGIIHTAAGREFGMAVGGVIGLAAAYGLLHLRVLPRSFDELEEQVTDPTPPDEFLNHPHPRREVLKECLFLAPPLAGAALGAWLVQAGLLGSAADLPAWAHVLGGVLSGYLVGGAIVWATRIFGTLLFGKEAMGLGDVHLLAGIGAVLGPVDATLVFFIAPFFGLAAAVILAGLASLLKGEVRMIPYGPYLAGATLVVMIAREPILTGLGF